MQQREPERRQVTSNATERTREEVTSNAIERTREETGYK